MDKKDKMENNTKLITDYISIWCWQLITILFFLATVIEFSFPVSWFSGTFGLAFCMTFMLSLYKVFKKKGEFFNQYGE